MRMQQKQESKARSERIKRNGKGKEDGGGAEGGERS